MKTYSEVELYFVFFRICDAKNDSIMNVRVLHSVNLRQSAVQLFVGNEMKIVSHLVGLDTIGFEDITNFKSTAVSPR